VSNYDLVIDANGKILGRLASFVAKRLLEGKRVAVVNAEKAIISGSPETILEKYQKRRSIEGKPKPTKGPVYPRTPDRIFWKTVRGMLPMKKAKGREALRRLRVFVGVPPELRKADMLELPLEYTVNNLRPKKQKKEVTVHWLAKSLGWKG